MKTKFTLFGIMLIISLIIIFPSVKSNNLGESIESVTGKIEKIEGIKSEIENNPKEYLQEKWDNYYNNSKIKAGLIKSEDKLNSGMLSKSISWIFGTPFSWTMHFFLNLILWLFLVTIIYRVLSVFSLTSGILRLVLSILLIIFMSMIGLTNLISLTIIEQVMNVKSWTLRIIVFLGIFFLLAILSAYSRLLENGMMKLKEKIYLSKIKETAKEAKEEAKEVEEKLNELKEEVKKTKKEIAKEKGKRTEKEEEEEIKKDAEEMAKSDLSGISSDDY
jgi:hypothetical protein